MTHQLKRYLVFTGIYYYPSGGWKDYAGTFEDLDEAKKLADWDKAEEHVCENWGQVVDGETGEVVYKGKGQDRT